MRSGAEQRYAYGHGSPLSAGERALGLFVLPFHQSPVSTPTASAIQPIVFGTADRRLLGILHAPAFVDTDRAGVVLCNPFGQEAIRAQRTMWVLAERLARAGHTVLRFDYYGTGDSMGDDLDGDLEGWADDVTQADRELRARSGAASTIWLGMRLGGAVVLGAAQRAPATLLRLILWDPVLDGVQYLEHLRQRHVEVLEWAFSVPLNPSPSALARDPLHYRDEALGFALSPLLRRQVAALRPTADSWPGRPLSIAVVIDPDAADGSGLRTNRDAYPSRVRVAPVGHGIDWTGEDGTLVPTAALAQLVQLAADPHD